MRPEDIKKIKPGVKIKRLNSSKHLIIGAIYTVQKYNSSTYSVWLEGFNWDHTILHWDIRNFELVEDHDLNPLDLVV